MTDLIFPRHVHKPAVSLIVETRDAYDAAIADGWSSTPVPVPVQKDGETCDLYTADALAVALEQGWTRVDDVATEPARKRSKK